MRNIELYFTKDDIPEERFSSGDCVALVVDVLRATSTMCSALSAGAKEIHFCEGVDEANALAKELGRDTVILAGERDCKKIDGFDLGNSPDEFTSKSVGDMIVIITTTNGTRALRAVVDAEDVIVGSFLNRAAVVSYLMDDERDLVVVCSGRFGGFAIDDALCAGSIIRELTFGVDDFELYDASNAAVYLAEYLDGQYVEVLEESASGKALEEAGLLKDVQYVAKMDKVVVVPLMDKERECLMPLIEETGE